jgi:hypothetical protein
LETETAAVPAGDWVVVVVMVVTMAVALVREVIVFARNADTNNPINRV